VIRTTHGLKDERELSRTTGFEDRPTEFVVWVEWRMPACNPPCAVCANPQNPLPAKGAVLVRRDAHCILKEPGVVAEGSAAELG
jgi:hypothetical protein